MKQLLYSSIEQIATERKRQDEKWGELPFLGTEGENYLGGVSKQYPCRDVLLGMSTECVNRIEIGCHGWFDVLLRSLSIIGLETDPVKQREEMIKVCAVGVSIVENLDRQIEGGKGGKGC